MKHKKLVTFFLGWGIAFGASFAAAGCLVTGMSMAVGLGTLAFWCGVASGAASLCYTLPLGAIPPACFALAAGFWWGDLKISFQSLLYRLSRQYDMAYGWGILKLNTLTADDMEPTLWLGICVLGAVIAMAVAWSVCRRRTAAPGILLTLLPLAACMVVTDTVPKTAFLYLLLFCLGVLLLTGPLRRQDEVQGNRLALITAGVLAAVLLVLFAACPRQGYTGQARAQALADSVLHTEFAEKLLGKFTENQTVGIVDGNRVDLETTGVRQESQVEVMRVTAHYDGTVYLRGRALDAYDGTAWYQSSKATTDLYWPEQGKLGAAGEVTVATHYAHRLLYLPYYVRSLDMSGINRGLENDKKLTQYSFSCSAPAARDRELTQYAAQVYVDWENSYSDYLHLSESVQKWAVPTAQKIVEGKENAYERAQAIGDFVRESAKYNMNTRRMPAEEEDFVRWFLSASETGYCVHFASAATVLLQAAGIPARYVTGYMAEVKAGEETVVLAKDAHAWTEYFLPGYGWTVLEATPAREESQQTQQTTVPEGQLPTEQTPTPETTPGSQNKEPDSKGLGAALWTALAVAILGAGLVIQSRVRLKLRKRKLKEGTENQRALALWQETVLFAQVLGQEPDRELFSLAQKAKFSQHTLEEAELQQFVAYLDSAQRRLSGRSLFRRFYFRVVLALY